GFRWTQFRLLLNPIFIIIGSYSGGIVGVAISQAIYSVLTIFFYRSIVIKKVIKDLTSADLLNSFYKPLIVSVVSFPILFYINTFLIKYVGNSYANIVINTVLVFVIFYVVLGKNIKLLINRFKR